MIEINKIYNEQNLETMDKMAAQVVDVVLTSPPYNIMRKNLKDRGYDEYIDEIDNQKYINWTLQIFKGFDKILKKNGVVLYNMSYGSENTNLMSLTVADIIKKSGFVLADIIVWKKRTAQPNNMSKNKLTRITEYVYVFCRKDELSTFITNKKEVSTRDNGQINYQNIFNFIEAENNDGQNELNKATFSTTLVRKLLQIYASPKALVYDPFMGTGTTAKACIINNLNFIGSEISETQCEFSNKRIEPYLKQKTLF